MSTITNAAGKEIDFSAACALMDKEISDTLDDADIETDQAFFDAYCDKHREKFGDEFEPNKPNPVW